MIIHYLFYSLVTSCQSPANSQQSAVISQSSLATYLKPLASRFTVNAFSTLGWDFQQAQVPFKYFYWTINQTFKVQISTETLARCQIQKLSVKFKSSFWLATTWDRKTVPASFNRSQICQKSYGEIKLECQLIVVYNLLDQFGLPVAEKTAFPP